jgi:hypothetical protein
MTKAKIQALVDCELRRPKAEVEWKAAVGDEFPTEEMKEQVVFVLYFERGFNLPVAISSMVCSTTTSWSRYISSPTPSL